MDIDNLKNLMRRVTPGPWHWIDIRTDEPFAFDTKWNGNIPSLRTVAEHPCRFGGTLPDFILNAEPDFLLEYPANAALIALAPDLSAEVLRLTAEHAQLVAANQALATENVRLVKQDAEATIALKFYADFYENPNDGPWGVNSSDFGKTARAFLAGEGK